MGRFDSFRSAEPSFHRKKWWQFNLLTLLVLVTAVNVVFACVRGQDWVDVAFGVLLGAFGGSFLGAILGFSWRSPHIPHDRFWIGGLVVGAFVGAVWVGLMGEISPSLIVNSIVLLAAISFALVRVAARR